MFLASGSQLCSEPEERESGTGIKKLITQQIILTDLSNLMCPVKGNILFIISYLTLTTLSTLVQNHVIDNIFISNTAS